MKLAILFLGILLCFQVILAQEAEEGSGAEEAVEESSGLKLYILRFRVGGSKFFMGGDSK